MIFALQVVVSFFTSCAVAWFVAVHEARLETKRLASEERVAAGYHYGRRPSVDTDAFREGDVVRLRSGSHAMTVTGYCSTEDGPLVIVVHSDERGLFEGKKFVPECALEKVSGLG